MSVSFVETTSRTVRLNLQAIDVDIQNPEVIARTSGVFLEGIDIAGEESFEELLREMRTSLADLANEMTASDTSFNSVAAPQQPH